MFLPTHPRDKHRQRRFWLWLIIFLLASIGVWYFLQDHKKIDYVFVNHKVVKVELADTPHKAYQGLSNRESLCQDCGMLFLFSEKKERSFVMRNMNFPLDIVWINNHKVINISENLPPEGEDYKNTYQSGGVVDSVLELNAGWCQKNKVKVGSIVGY
ncbi:MAG: DUF192 domain-containing protein [Planctomycetes bacterium]|jgi:hypothetical protein|nr:DUF192 domain-containing protein [Planctomycetota bacterium]